MPEPTSTIVLGLAIRVCFSNNTSLEGFHINNMYLGFFATAGISLARFYIIPLFSLLLW
jgi:hypothetical protein